MSGGLIRDTKRKSVCTGEKNERKQKKTIKVLKTNEKCNRGTLI